MDAPLAFGGMQGPEAAIRSQVRGDTRTLFDHDGRLVSVFLNLSLDY